MVPLLSLIMQQYNVHINVTMRRVRATIVAVEKQYALHILSVSLALVIHHAIRMRYIAICGLSDCTVFSTLSHKRHDVRKKFLKLKCVFWISVKLLFKILLFLRSNGRGVIKNVRRSSCEVHVIFVR